MHVGTSDVVVSRAAQRGPSPRDFVLEPALTSLPSSLCHSYLI